MKQTKTSSSIVSLLLIISLSVCLGFGLTQATRAAALTGDLNNDGTVNRADLDSLLSHFTKSGAYKDGDLNNDAKITLVDLSIMLSNYGKQAPTPANQAGRVNFVLRNTGATDTFVGNGSATTQQWIRDHYWRMEIFVNYFRDKTGWYQNGWNYKDSTSSGGVYTVLGQHQDWILKDSAGNKLYIPWGCDDGCDSYAVDVGNPALRAEWIRQAKAELATGTYKGLWIDDVNMDWRVSDVNGNNKLPIDPRTGQTMTLANWRRYLAEFMEQVRSEMPNIEILHNSIWYAGSDNGYDRDPYITRATKAADYINRESGFNDGGLTGGTGTFSLNALLAYFDRVHALGKHVVIDSFTNNVTDREYGLAGYLLINDGGDGYGNSDASYPSNWWSGYDTNLGSANGARYDWGGLLRRDFSGGIVLVNGPGSGTKTVDLGGSYQTTSGNRVTSITLGPSRGAILKK